MDSSVFGILVSIQKIFVRSRVTMSRLSCVQNRLCPDYRAFKIAYVQTIVRSKSLMSRLSCVQNCICPDYRAFKIAYVQTIVRSFFSRPCNFERMTPPCSFISVWTYRLSVWELNLGIIKTTVRKFGVNNHKNRKCIIRQGKNWWLENIRTWNVQI